MIESEAFPTVGGNLTYLHAILELGDYRALRDEREELAAPCEWQWDDESTEDEHLRHQEEEDLEEEQK